MPAYIPIVNTKGDWRIFNKYFTDASIVRITLEADVSIRNQIYSHSNLWIDPAFDGYEHHLKNPNKYPIPTYLQKYTNSAILGDYSCLLKPDHNTIKTLVIDVLNDCLALRPTWLTIPQLPIEDNNRRNKINLELARVTREWKNDSHFNGKLVLPVIFTHRSQLDGKTKWGPRIQSVIKWYENANADYVWVVDSSMSDQEGTSSLLDRFRNLIEMHKYLREKLSSAEIIAGPYWGVNLILWTRNLCDKPAISLGTAYQYYLSGAPFIHPRSIPRIAIPALKRWVVVKPELRQWLDDSLRQLNKSDKNLTGLENIKTELEQQLKKFSYNYDRLTEDVTREQVVRFYKSWLDQLERIPPSGRPLALYQDFSSAFVLGKHLPTLPSGGGSARRPEKVAEYFMPNCF